ncbi:hypothetical protein E2A64_10205 [Pseudohoeflea suaedae]|uniref:Uncharacterized protein n=1 Tax=Pseudohoeflea suaedae TaxID=877384 RepID=A0A4R5PJ73_9HYPH|nr:hypothetical protein [Pseudohoeflea suaedae]TDH35703.1 hypothetical protein E2A64_10205 [Pseudohoeflea suaedae]
MTEPITCHVCGFRATGLGIAQRNADPKWLCTECALIAERIREVRRMDPYELKALDGGVDAAGDFIAANGADLSEYDEETARMLCKAVWKGCADRLRHLLVNGEAPF